MSFSSSHLYFDDLEIGQEWLSSRRTVTEADIVNFAGFSGDFNPIHMDHEFAKGTPFRRPIAHRFGIFCIASGPGHERAGGTCTVALTQGGGLEVQQPRVRRATRSTRRARSARRRSAAAVAAGK